jgi:cyclohexanecarboxylate-CoA ligase
MEGTVLVPTGDGVGALFGALEQASSRGRDASPIAPDGSPARPTDIAVALFTSGSTGAPKVVLHTHRGLGYKAALMARVHGLRTDDAALMPAPLAHVSGLLNGVLLPATVGIPSVVMGSWDPERALDLIERERVSFMGAPPVFFSQMAAASGFGRERVSTLRLVSTGGASVSPAFVDATAEAFGCRVKRTYGSTEAPTVTTSGPDDSPERARDTDGHPVGEVELEVHDPDTGARLAPGAVGELWLRGPELFVGYADAASTTAALSPTGRWFRTGDLGTLDPDGWLRVVGRLSDIIIRAGENISASEVEAALEAHPAVRHAVAVGVPDPDVGERVAAFVEASEPFDLAACRAWFVERGVTRFKTPEFVVQIEHVPVLAAGKPDRAALRKMAVDVAGSTRSS